MTIEFTIEMQKVQGFCNCHNDAKFSAVSPYGTNRTRLGDILDTIENDWKTYSILSTAKEMKERSSTIENARFESADGNFLQRGIQLLPQGLLPELSAFGMRLMMGRTV